MLSEKPRKQGLPIVVCVDRFYMSEKAMKTLQKQGKIIWADCENEDGLIREVQNVKPKVIISEYFKISGRVMDASPNLKGIVVWGVGYDHIDVEAASERGIYVVNTRGSNAESVAEHVFAFMLCLSRRLLRADNLIKEEQWTAREESGLPEGLVAQDLYGKTIGIVGLGAVGSCVAKIAHGFNMRVLAYDPFINVEVAKDRGASLVSLENLLRKSDFVTFHVVLTEETKNMISTKELKLMKTTAYLINASRGPVIDEKALIKALRQKRIAGVGLDVFTEEPIDINNPLLKIENVIVTPHCAGNSKEALERTSLMVSEEAIRILSNNVPRNLVNKSQLVEKGYLR